MNDLTAGSGTTPEKRSDPRIRRTRKAFRLALQELIQEVPLDDIMIRDIVDRADIAYTTFFRHYPTKEALLADLAAEQVGQVLDLSYPVMRERGSLASCETVCNYVDDNRGLWTALLTGPAQNAMRTAYIEQTLAREGDWTPVQVWLPRDVAPILAVATIIELLTWWLTEPTSHSPSQIAEIMDRVIVSTLMGEAAQKK